MTDFNELCRTLNVTDTEREKLAWHLAMFRAKKTYTALRGKP